MKLHSTIEIAGLCGTGKSTLAEMLGARSENVETGFSIWRNPKFAVAASLISSLPELVQKSLADRNFVTEAAQQMIRLAALEKNLNSRRSSADHHRQISVVDEGAVFLLAKNLFERNDAHHSFSVFEKDILEHWSAKLDAIIWLDAPNEILAQRIRARAKKHRMKFQDDSETHEFLNRYRAAYEKILSEFARSEKVDIHRFDTLINSPNEIADKIIGYFDLPRVSRSRDLQNRNSRVDYVESN